MRYHVRVLYEVLGSGIQHSAKKHITDITHILLRFSETKLNFR